MRANPESEPAARILCTRRDDLARSAASLPDFTPDCNLSEKPDVAKAGSPGETIMIHRRHLTSGLAAAVGAGLLGLPGAAAAKPKIGQPAPKFTLHTFDRRKVTLADLAGKVIVLNFWRSGADPASTNCR